MRFFDWLVGRRPRYDGPFSDGMMAAVLQQQSRIRKSHELDACESDAERYKLATGWASEARALWYRGQTEAITDMLLSEDIRYRYMSAEERRAIGLVKWSKSPVSKDLAGLEQMYSRWAQEFAAGAALEGR